MVAGTVSRNPTPYHANERDIDNVKFSGNPDDDSVGTEPTVASSVKTEASYNDFLSFVGSSSAEKASQKEIAEPKQFSRTLTASTADCTVGDVDESSDSSASNSRGSVNERREQPSPTNIENSNTLTKDEDQKKTPESVIPESENFDQTKKAEILKGASIATLHFATEETRKEVERVKAINIAKQAAKENSKAVVPLPADYFTKQNEARLEAEKQAALDGLKDAPIAVRKMTLRGFEEKEAALKAQQEMSTQQRSAATSHFQKKQEEAANKVASTESNVMPVAIQKFTVAAREEKQKRQAEIEALKTNKNDQMPAAQSYFTEKAKEDKAKRDAENQRLKENPVTTAAGAHFAKIEEQKKAELEKVKEAPVITHAAGEHFNRIAQEEKERMAEAAKQREGRENPNLIATDYFARKEKEEKMAQEERIRIAREAAKEKSKAVESLPADYFTKQNEARLEAEKQAALDGLKDAPIAVRKMTLRGFEEKKAALKAQQEMSTQQRSAATSHFQKKQEEAANKAASTESNVMPVAIQKFTVAAREEKQKRQAEIEALKTNKNDQMPAAQSYFTEKAKEDKAKRDAENQRLKESPAMTAAGAHFAKVEEQKKAELEKLRENPEPMPAGQAYFTNKAREERNQTVEGCEKVSADESASKYLAKLKIEEQRLAELQKTE